MSPEKKKKLLELYKKSSKPEEIFIDVLEHMGTLEAKVNEMADIVIDLVSKEDPKPKEGPPGRHGKDGIGKEGPPGPAGSPDTPEQIRDKIASLKGKQKLSVLDLKDTEWLRRWQQNGNVIGQQASFITLTDTPKSYVGQAGKVPVVNSAETGLIFGAAGYSRAEIPTGPIDGMNQVFNLSATPGNPSTILVMLNGSYQTQLGASPDYVISGATITFATPPEGDTLVVIY